MFKGVEDIEMFGEIFIGLNVGELVPFATASKNKTSFNNYLYCRI